MVIGRRIQETPSIDFLGVKAWSARTLIFTNETGAGGIAGSFPTAWIAIDLAQAIVSGVGSAFLRED